MRVPLALLLVCLLCSCALCKLNPVLSLTPPPNTIHLQYSARNEYLVLGNATMLNIYTPAGQYIQSIAGTQQEVPITAFGFRQSDSELLVGYGNGLVEGYELRRGVFVRGDWRYQSKNTTRVVSICENWLVGWIVIGYQQDEIVVIDAYDRENIRSVGFGNEFISSVACSSIRAQIVVAGGGNTYPKLALYAITTAGITRTDLDKLPFEPKLGDAIRSAIYSNSNYQMKVYAGGDNGVLFSVDLATKEVLKLAEQPDNKIITKVHLSKNDSIVYVTQGEVVVRGLEAASNEQQRFPTVLDAVAASIWSTKLTYLSTTISAQVMGPCPVGQYPDVNSTCQLCQQQDCLICENLDECFACAPFSSLSIPGGRCEPCQPNCLSCAKDEGCFQCGPTFVLEPISQTCRCPPATFLSSGKCKVCIEFCETCFDGESCLTCQQGYYLGKGKCLLKGKSAIVLVYVVGGMVAAVAVVYLLSVLVGKLMGKKNKKEERLVEETAQDVEQ